MAIEAIKTGNVVMRGSKHIGFTAKSSFGVSHDCPEDDRLELSGVIGGNGSVVIRLGDKEFIVDARALINALEVYATKHR